MKSRVVLLSIKVAVITVSSSSSLIFILSALLGDVSVGGTAVGGGLVGAAGSAVGVGGSGVSVGIAVAVGALVGEAGMVGALV